MAISFNPEDLLDYFFCSLGEGQHKADCCQYLRFAKAFERNLMARGHKHIHMQDIDDELPGNFALSQGEIICLDISAIEGHDRALEEKYDAAYGSIAVSSSLREAMSEARALREEATADAERAPSRYNGKIFCLMGKSASGKDTVYSEVRKSFDELGLRQLVMYTTRPKRVGEEDGHEYNFVTPEELEAMDSAGKVIERRDYDTIYGIWSYAIVNDDQLSSDQDYVIKEETPEGYEKLAAHFGSEHVIPIYIYVEDGVRLLRALSREMGQDRPRYDEMCRRYLSDCGDFAEIDADKSMMRFVNDNIEKCSEDIVSYIRDTLGLS